MIPDRAHHAHRYIAWLGRHARVILLAHALVFVLAVYLIAFRLPLFADFSYLLPQDAPAVADLRKLEARVKTGDTLLVVLEAPTSEARADAAKEFAAGARTLDPELVAQIDDDDSDVCAFFAA